MASGQFRLKFRIANGMAKGYEVCLTNKNLDDHKIKYGSFRPELNDDKFFDTDVVNVMNNPDVVYGACKLDPITKQLKIIKNTYLFYKENQGRRYIFNGKELRWYIKVVVKVKSRLFKSMEILTPFYTSNVIEQKRCQPITNI
ncbi:MAG: hypothetical protein Q8R55_02445 [Candidatus Taylorbacteria bacterium]|nr:hypothetical protein [Candidatus Taylorbacteria bacterium]